MKKFLLVAALLTPLSANAKSPEEVGRLYADVVACHIGGEYTKAEKIAINIEIARKYDIGRKSQWWKDRMKKGKRKEFSRLEGMKDLKKYLMCSIIKDQWL